MLRHRRRRRLEHRQACRPWVIRHRFLRWVGLRPLLVNLRMRVVLMMHARQAAPRPIRSVGQIRTTMCPRLGSQTKICPQGDIFAALVGLKLGLLQLQGIRRVVISRGSQVRQ